MNESFDAFFTWQGQQTGLLIYLTIILGITLSNLFVLRHPRTYPPPPRWPHVAVLVPARNEEATIERCVESLLAQDYPDYEIWVLDDQSEDQTAHILKSLADRDPRLHVLNGRLVPDGWLGKPWACQQLAEASHGELLLFVDADTWHHPAMLRSAVAALIAEQADLLSVIPDEVMITLAEKLAVPLIPWSLFTHFPLAVGQRTHWPPLATAIGQMMLFRRRAYEGLGGHATVRAEVAEDMALARAVARQGGRWCLLDGTRLVYCRMYDSFAGVLSGFGKNLFAVFGHNLPLYLFVWLWLGIVFLSPWPVLLWTLFFPAPFSPRLALIAILLATLIWGLYAWKFRASPLLVLLYPAVMATAFLLAFHSLGQHLTSSATWKGRALLSRETPHADF
jgi:chlorobactene glucosyltransferase